MRTRWLLSLGACALGAGLVDAQPGTTRVQPPTDSRSPVPALQQTPNVLPEPAALRGFTASDDGRTALPPSPDRPAGRALSLIGDSDRHQVPGADPKAPLRTLLTSDGGRDVLIGRAQTGDVANKITEAAGARALLGDVSTRSYSPANPAGLTDRSVLGER